MVYYPIDDECIAPMSNFEDLCWQQGPYWDVDMGSSPDWWQSWKCGVWFDATESDFDKVEMLKEGIHTGAIENKTLFVIRDSKRIAHSRRAHLTEVKRLNGKWAVPTIFTT